MRFGSRVWVTRGSSACPPGTPGCLRERLGTLVGARGHMRVVRLEEDDALDTVGWNKKSHIGYWEASIVKLAKRQEPVPRPGPCPHCGGEGILCLDTTTGPEPTYRVRCRRLSCGHAGHEDAEALRAVELWGSATYVALTP